MVKRFAVSVFNRSGLGGSQLGLEIRRQYRKLVGRNVADLDRMAVVPDTSNVTVAFRVTGGIGDHLIAARYIRDLIRAVGDFRFDVYSSRPEVTRWIFRSFEGFNRTYDEYFSWHSRHYYRLYSLALTVQQFVTIQHDAVQWPRLNNDWPKLPRICENLEQFRHARDLNEIISAHPRLDGLLGDKAVFTNLNRHDFAHSMSGIAYGGHRLSLSVDPSLKSRFGLGDRPYITIHNGFDAEFIATYGYASRSTKVYPHFDEVVAKLRVARPDLYIVQLGTKTSQPIAGVDLQLINATSLDDMAAVIAGSTLHIDNESGLVHLAACLGTLSCVLFGPTPSAYFGYETNINMSPRECGGCWWSTRDWMTNCPRGFEKPVCLDKTPPQVVAEAALRALSGEYQVEATDAGTSLYSGDADGR